jgi:hypothetical protein
MAAVLKSRGVDEREFTPAQKFYVSPQRKRRRIPDIGIVVL